MKAITRRHLEKILTWVLSCQPEHIEDYVRNEVVEFLAVPRTAMELYDYCNKLAEMPIEATDFILDGKKVYAGDVSITLKTICNVEVYFLPPEIDGPRLVDWASHCEEFAVI
jgi:hypothetical protein